MNHIQTALNTFVDAKLGIREAAALVAIGDGATVEDIAKATRQTKDVIRARIGTLHRKDLIRSKYLPDGRCHYTTSKSGSKILAQAEGGAE